MKIKKTTSNHYDLRDNHFNSETQQRHLPLENWCTISWLNNYNKISVLLWAVRLKLVLDSVTEETQSDFMKH